MIIDCHGHFTTAPAVHTEFRAAQLARLADPRLPEPAPVPAGDDELREAVENNQLRLLRERGGDLMVFSPQASAMGHHVPDPGTAVAWARESNNLVHRVVPAGTYDSKRPGHDQLRQSCRQAAPRRHPRKAISGLCRVCVA